MKKGFIGAKGMFAPSSNGGSGSSNPDPGIALSDETSDITTDNDAEIYLIRPQQSEAFIIALNNAPTDASVLVDVIIGGSTTIGQIEVTPGNRVGTLTLSYALPVGWLKFDCVQVGATLTGRGMKGYVKSSLL